jgi:hypothetical protein
MGAKVERERLIDEVGKAEAAISSVAKSFGEHANSDPATLFAVIWTLALAFDRAYTFVGQCISL